MPRAHNEASSAASLAIPRASLWLAVVLSGPFARTGSGRFEKEGNSETRGQGRRPGCLSHGAVSSVASPEELREDICSSLSWQIPLKARHRAQG